MSDTVEIDMSQTNDNLVLITGASAVGKSMGLRTLRNHEKVMYLNCESGKKLPFKNKFKSFIITEPLQVFEGFDHALNNPDYDVIVIDTLTFLMDMFETQHVINSSNTMKGWSDYNQFFKILMQDKIARSDKAVVILAHSAPFLNEQEAIMETRVPIKGALKNNGVESYFSCVVAAKKASMKILAPFDGKTDLLTISDRERHLGYKHVFQTQLTKDTIHERIRGPVDLFDESQTFMNNDAQLLLDHLAEYYR